MPAQPPVQSVLRAVIIIIGLLFTPNFIRMACHLDEITFGLPSKSAQSQSQTEHFNRISLEKKENYTQRHLQKLVIK
jgi:hypothetical protein